MIQFYETVMGKKFFNSDIPQLIKGINRLAEAIEKQNELTQKMAEKPMVKEPKKTDPDMSELKDLSVEYIMDRIVLNWDRLKPTDTEGYEYEGTVWFNDQYWPVHISYYDETTSWEESIAQCIYEQIHKEV